MNALKPGKLREYGENTLKPADEENISLLLQHRSIRCILFFVVNIFSSFPACWASRVGNHRKSPGRNEEKMVNSLSKLSRNIFREKKNADVIQSEN